MSTIKKLFAFAAIISASALFGQFNAHLYQDEISIAKQYVNYLYNQTGEKKYQISSWLGQYTNCPSYYDYLSATELVEVVAIIASDKLTEEQKINSIYEMVKAEKSTSSSELANRVEKDKKEDQKRQNKSDAKWYADSYTNNKRKITNAIKESTIMLSASCGMAFAIVLAMETFKYKVHLPYIDWLTAPSV